MSTAARDGEDSRPSILSIVITLRPSISNDVIDFRQSSSSDGAVSTAEDLPVAINEVISASKLAPVPACGLSKRVIGAGPLIRGRSTGVMIAAIALANDASPSKGKSQIISLSNSVEFLTSSMVGFSCIGGRFSPGAGT